MGIVNLKTKSQRIAYMDRNAYVSRPERYSKIKADNVIAYASQSSNVPESSLRGALLGVQQAIVLSQKINRKLFFRFTQLAFAFRTRTTHDHAASVRELLRKL